ncbi:MAG TPA: SAM-dependent methyltransferase, partial [Candidatus Nanopelagicales bacterium]|nr:SAM-dependent methyltransferase [Candidatus Nanopelagicales bacterium]
MTSQGWAAAWTRALYGDAGFYRTGCGASRGPGGHFRTSVHVGPVFAGALAELLCRVDDRLGRPAVLDLVDVGAGRGELAAGIVAALPAAVAARVRAVAVDLRERPAGLDPRVGWVTGGAPQVVSGGYPDGVRGLLLAHEWLDDLPCEVVEVDAQRRPRLVVVDPAGTESAGPLLTDVAGCAELGVDAPSAQSWLRRWWPVEAPGERAEVGERRDR